jgi:hypothetical protein
MKITKSELKTMIREVLREELSRNQLKEHHYPELEPIECENCGRIVGEDEYRLHTNEYDEEIIVCPTCAELLENSTLDVSASEVDDLAKDVFIDAKFEDAYKADGYTVGEAVEALIVEVVSSEYPNVDLGSVPDRVSNALSNMLETGLLG